MRLLKFTLVTFLLGLRFVHAEIIPVTSIRSLVDSTDLVITGTVERVQQTGAGSIELNGRDYDRLDFQAEIRVDATIKGEPVGPSLYFELLDTIRGQPRKRSARSPTAQRLPRYIPQQN